MAEIILRSSKTSAITFSEMDANIDNINTEVVQANTFLNAATDNNVPNRLVLRNNVGDISVNNVFGYLEGAARRFTSTADNSSALVHYLTFVTEQTGDQIPKSDNALSYVPSTNTLTAGVFNGTATLTSLSNTGNTSLGATSANTLTVAATSNFTAATTTFSGDISVNGGDIVTNQATASLYDATVTNFNLARAGTSIVIGATTGTTTVRNSLIIGTGIAWHSNNDGAGSGLDADLLDGFEQATANTPNTIVRRDASGNFSAGTINAALTGNATTATTLQTARTISLSGDVVGSVSFNGGSNVTIAATIQPDSVALGTDTTGNYISTATAGTGISITGSGTETAAITVTNTGVTSLVGGNAITVSGATGTVTVNHADTSNVVALNSNNANGVVLQDIAITYDTFGHVQTSTVATVDLDTRYYTETESDARFVNTTGDTMTGRLVVPQGVTGGIAFPDNAFGGTGDTASITLQNTTGEDTKMVFTIGNEVTDTFSFIAPSNLDGITYNNFRIWHEGNDGSGSGLDADTVDGYETAVSGVPSTIVVRDAFGNINGTITGTTDNANKTAVLSDNSNAVYYPAFVNSADIANGFATLRVDNVTTPLSYNPSTSTLTATSFAGNATTASTLQTARTISLTGDVTGSVSFNGGANVSIAATIAPNSVALGADTTGNYIATVVGTPNQINVAGSGVENANVQLSLPQSIATNSDVTFNSVITNQAQMRTSDVTLATTTANQVVDTTSGALYRAVKYVIQVSLGTSHQATEIMAIHDGSTAISTEYATIMTNGVLATFDVTYTGGNLLLWATPTSANTKIKVLVNAISV